MIRDPVTTPEVEAPADPALRPRNFDEFVGQERIVTNLRTFIRAALRRGEALDHTLLSGPPGLGKTSLAYIIAEELGVDIFTASGPTLDKSGKLVAQLTKLEPRQVLFIDEIHRLPRTIEEILYPALEDYQVDIVYGDGPGAESIKIPLAPFTMVGATTRSGMLTSPLRARFKIQCTMDFYSVAEVEEVLRRAARRMDVVITPDGCHELARRSRGTPRIGNRLLRRVRDFAEVDGDGTIDEAITRVALERLDIDDAGLDKMDRRILHTIAVKFSGGPVGLNTLSAAVGESEDTIEDAYEPYLIQRGFLMRTPRGRVVTPRGLDHIGLKVGEIDPQQRLL